MKLYHVTPAENIASILTDGLDTARSRSNQSAVYLAASPDEALNYVSMHSIEFDSFLMLEVEVDDDLTMWLGPDDYELRELIDEMSELEKSCAGVEPDDEWFDIDWRRSLELCGQVACLVPISASSITVLGSIDATVHPLLVDESSRLVPLRTF